MIKVLLLCSSRFALPALRDLLFHKQLAVVAIPGFNEDMVQQADLLLKGSGVPLLQVDKQNCNVKLADAIKNYGVNTGLIMSFSYKIPLSVYTLPEKGFFNIHPGPLPGYRGADPVFWQIKNKEKNAGVCIHKLDNGFDTGPVVIQEMIKIEKNDTYGLLTTKLSALAATLVATLLKLLSFDIAIPSKVQDESKAVYYKKQTSKEVTINWERMDADTIVALINACNPWNKGAITKINDNIIRLLEAEKPGENTADQKAPGMLIAFRGNDVIVSAIGNTLLKVRIIYIEEGFFTASRLAQLGITPGTCFESI